MKWNDYLLQARERKKLTQAQAAERLGVRVQSIWNWENEVNRPQMIRLPEIASVYGVPVQEVRAWVYPEAVDQENLKLEGQSEALQDGDRERIGEPVMTERTIENLWNAIEDLRHRVRELEADEEKPRSGPRKGRRTS